MKSAGVGLLALVITTALVVVTVAQSGRISAGPGEDKIKKERRFGATVSESGHDVTRLETPTIKELAKTLSPGERYVILEKGTEVARSSELDRNKKSGIYTCRLCALPLYSSKDKYDSGTGWPSFTRPIDPLHVHQVLEVSLGVARNEIVCRRCNGHLGHVFDDGPAPTGMRYCMNGTALQFFASNDKLPPAAKPIQKREAYFAGGCFWGIEDKFQQVPGVLDAVSGYMGGSTSNPTYRQVLSKKTGHAETVRVTYNANAINYDQLLEWFFKFHDPTQLNRQGPDIGPQYRSAIFAADDDQERNAKQTITELQQSDNFKDKKIVTEVVRAGPFTEAEEYHQNYHAKHGGSCSIND